MIEFFNTIYSKRHIILSLVRQDIKGRYNRSVLGILWAIISPLMFASIVSFVYGKLFNINFEAFFPYFFSGLITWIFILSSANSGTAAFLSAEGYIKQINLPIQIFPVRTTLVNLFHYSMAIFAYLAFGLFGFLKVYTPNILLITPCLLILFWICSSMAAVTAFLNAYFRDYVHLQTIALQALFYVTPIIYKPSMLASRGGGAYIYEYNPFYYMIELVRQPLLGKVVPLKILVVNIAIGIVLNIVMLLLYKYKRHQIVFKL